MKNEEFKYLVLSIISEIPFGKVASYGQIAKMSGYPKNARQVGSILSRISQADEYPCHRVVHNNGSLTNAWPQQADLLLKEGITSSNNKVDMMKHRWN